MKRIRIETRERPTPNDASARGASAFGAAAFGGAGEGMALVPVASTGAMSAAPSGGGAIALGGGAGTAAWPGGSAGAAHAAGESSPDATPSRARWSWLRAARRLVLNAAIAVGVMALVPIGLVAVRGGALADMLARRTGATRSRIAGAEALRAFGVATDRSITPEAAGRAFGALHHPRDGGAGFIAVDVGPRPEAPWRTVTLDADLFPTARPDMYPGPSSRHILEAAADGFTPRELAYLRTLATAPLWRSFDLVARAPAVDIVGGQFVTPFGPAARPEQRPLIQFRDSKELAYAAVSRAAYHLAIGQRDSAEAALRAVVSFGFAFVDNGTTSIDAMIGTVIAGIGRDALQRLYAIEHDPRAGDPALARGDALLQSDGSWRVASAAAARQSLLARIEDPATPLGVRFDDLRSLPLTACTNTRELLFGSSADVRTVLDRAPTTVARFPSERALLELDARIPLIPAFAGGSPVSSVAVSMATVAGVVLDNPRLQACTMMLVGR